MNKSFLLKIVSALLIMICCLGLTTTISLAESVWLDPPAAQGSELIEPTQNIVGEILAVVQVIGVSVAIIMLIVLAIKYISAAPNDKAEIKKHAVVYVVGAVILFAASAIVGIIRNFAQEAFNTKGDTKGDQTVTPEETPEVTPEGG